MKKKIHVCDICGSDLNIDFYQNPFKIKIKEYDERYILFKWRKIEICSRCASKIYNYCINGGN